MSFWQENFPFVKSFYDDRSTKFLELMDKAEQSIAEIHADKIYTSKEFNKIRTNFTNIAKNLERPEVREWLNSTKEMMMEGRKNEAEDAKLTSLVERFSNLLPSVNETKTLTDMLWKSYEYTDEMAPLVEFATEQLGAASREVTSGNVAETEGLIDKHNKTMDKIEKKKVDMKNLIAKGEKLATEARAPEFLVEKVNTFKALWTNTMNVAKDQLNNLKDNAGNWNTYTEMCIELTGRIEVAQGQINDIKKLYDMGAAKDDHIARVNNANDIKAEVNKKWDVVLASKNILFNLADDGMKAQLDSEMEEFKNQCKVKENLDEKLVLLNEFNVKLIAFDKSCKELEEIVVKDRKILDDLIKPPTPMKSNDRLVQAMDLREDIDGQLIIHSKCQSQWDAELQPEGSEDTAEAKTFVSRMTAVVDTLNKLAKEAEGSADKFGDDIVHICEFNASKGRFNTWIITSEERASKGWPAPSKMEEATQYMDEANAWKVSCETMKNILDSSKESAKKCTLPEDMEKEIQGMVCRWDVVHKSSLEWITKMTELKSHWTKETETLGKVTAAMNAKPGEMTAEDLDKQIETVKEMYKKKQELMKKMSTSEAPTPEALSL